MAAADREDDRQPALGSVPGAGGRQRVFVGLWGDAIAAIPEGVCLSHNQYVAAVTGARTYGDIRRAGITEVDEFDALNRVDALTEAAIEAGRVTEEDLEDLYENEVYDLVRPLDTDPLDPDHDAMSGLQPDWRPTATAAAVFDDLLGDLGQADTGWNIDYEPVEFEIPSDKQSEVVQRLQDAGYEVIEVGDISSVWDT